MVKAALSSRIWTFPKIWLFFFSPEKQINKIYNWAFKKKKHIQMPEQEIINTLRIKGTTEFI